MSGTHHVADQITFPSGLTIPNRLIKAAMAENLAVKGHLEKSFATLYSEWGRGGWGAVMTGNVMIDQKYLGQPTDAIIPPTQNDKRFEAWKAIAASIKANGSAALMQINHPGRQSPAGAGSKGFFTKNLAPSAIPLNYGPDLFSRSVVKLLFGTPAELSTVQIQQIIAYFVEAAKFAHSTGFDGVEIHAAHGYLLSDFLSPRANQRTDAFGGTPAKRAEIIVQIIRGVRKEVGKSFTVAVKMNSADQQDAADMEAVLEQVSVLAAEEIDFLEISGGSYENPKMMGANSSPSASVESKSASTEHREAYFLTFAAAVRERHPDLYLMLTGGFRTRSAMNAALESRACDIIGIGRPAAVAPDFPKSVIGIGAAKEINDSEAGLPLKRVPEPWIAGLLPNKRLRNALRGGAETTFYVGEMKKIAA